MKVARKLRLSSPQGSWVAVLCIPLAAVLVGAAGCGTEESGSGEQPTRTITATPPTVTVTAHEPATPPRSESTDGTSETQYLNELTPLTTTAGVDTNSAEINGRGFARTVTLIAHGGSAVNSAEYNLGRHWGMFSATLGLRDDSPTGGRLTFEVSVDEKQRFSKEISLGSSLDMNVDVRNALRLKLTVTYSGQDLGTYYGCWGDARLH